MISMCSEQATKIYCNQNNKALTTVKLFVPSSGIFLIYILSLKVFFNSHFDFQQVLWICLPTFFSLYPLLSSWGVLWSLSSQPLHLIIPHSWNIIEEYFNHLHSPFEMRTSSGNFNPPESSPFKALSLQTRQTVFYYFFASSGSALSVLGFCIVALKH